MKKIIVLFLMIASIDVLASSNDRSLISYPKDCDISSHKIDYNKPMILLKSISVPINWSRTQVNFRELYSKINYSVWYDTVRVDNHDEMSFFVLSHIRNQLERTLKKDSVFCEKMQDKYFCFGLIKHIEKQVPHRSTRDVGISLGMIRGLDRVSELLAEHHIAQLELSRCNWENMMSLFDDNTESFRLGEEGDGFYTLQCNDRSYSIDLDWTDSTRNSQKKNILELMLEEGATQAIDLLLATNKFDIKDFIVSNRLLSINAHPRSIAHLIEKYGLSSHMSK